MSVAIPAQHSPRRSINYLGIIWLAVLSLVAVPIYWFGFLGLFAAWITPEYSHGPLIPLISLYLFMRELRDMPPPPPGRSDTRIPGIALMAFALAFGFFGNLVKIPDFVSYALILWFGGLVLVAFGWGQGRMHWAPVLHLIFMLPLPQIIYWRLSSFLQGISSEIGVWVIRLVDIPVLLEGNIINLGVYQLQVAEACSGLRYLFPILSFSYLFGILYRGPFWHKAVLFIMAAPLTILMNSFRVGMIGVLVNSYGIGQAEGFLHIFEGWVIFGACIVILFLTALLLQSLLPNPKPMMDILDLDTEGMLPIFARLGAIRLTVWHGLALAVSVAITAIFIAYPAPESIRVERDRFGLFPRTVDQWESERTLLDPEIEEVLAADDYINAVFFSPEGKGDYISFFSAWYAKQTEGQAIHSPEACLPGGGWEVSAIENTEVTIPGTVYGTFSLNRAIIQKGSQKQLVYYWFEQRGKRMTNDFAVKLSVLQDTLLTGRGDGALVRLVTPINGAGPEAEAEADAYLQDFMGKILKRLPRFIPE